jgi:glucuronoarabinoxylan endo-1,4-beta-xylanase
MCTPTVEPTARVVIDTTARHQTLVGFGASLSYVEDPIVAHAHKAALYDLVFAESGLDVLRVRNRYGDDSETNLTATREIITEAEDRLGRRPLLFLTSGSPPAALKVNADRFCGGDPEACTLVSLPDGDFDYAGFADYWRGSLEAYADADLAPDYVSIQNNPNWAPPADNANEACRFLPVEGTLSVMVDGADVDVAYPGYREALAAVESAVADLPVVPRFAAPEANELGVVGEYLQALDASAFDAVAIHLYYLDVATVDASTFSGVRNLSEQVARPVFQTEVQADGQESAILIHHALTAAGASAYMQQDLVALSPAGAPIAMALMTADGVEAQGPFYAISHYAKSTDPGWVRVDAISDTSDVLSSAWISPDESALTAVLVNPANDDHEVEIVLPDELRTEMASTHVTRTVFEGVERAAMLGELPMSGIVHVPGGSIVTVAVGATP